MQCYPILELHRLSLGQMVGIGSGGKASWLELRKGGFDRSISWYKI